MSSALLSVTAIGCGDSSDNGGGGAQANPQGGAGGTTSVDEWPVANLVSPPFEDPIPLPVDDETDAGTDDAGSATG